MKLQIKTLSPIHIGSGEKYNGLSYIVNRGKVLFYDLSKITENITLRYSEKFTQWIEQRVTEIENLEKQKRDERDENRKKSLTQLLREAQKKLSLKEFIENSVRDVTIKNKFSSNFLYSLEARSQVYNNVDIECFIKQNNKPYIPGTEIKGAIRTALLYNFLQMDINWKWLKDEIEEFAKRHKDDLQQVAGKKGRVVNDIKKKLVAKMGEIEERLQVQVFRSANHDDAKYDLLKVLHITDSELKDPQGCLFVSNLKIEGISRTFPVFQELCKENQTFTCQGFKLDNNKTVLDKLGFNDEQKWVVSDVKNIFQCCYEFSNRLLNEELTYFNNNQIIKKKLQAIKELNKPDSPVIRIGKNEGYLSLTMGLLVKDKDQSLYDNVLCHATKYTSYTSNFPKTRRIVNLGNNDVDTCGWVKLQVIT